jgi:hypothetical protein
MARDGDAGTSIRVDPLRVRKYRRAKKTTAEIWSETMLKIKAVTTACLLGAAVLARAEEPDATKPSETAPTEAVKQQSAEDLAKKTQNPVADLYSFPFQDNISFDVGPTKSVQNVLNFQPVIPIHLGEVNLITRTIVPIITQPSPTPGVGGTTGLGDITFTAFLSPAGAGTDFIWGIGPVVSFPTATSPLVGSQSTWGLGASGVALTMQGPWVIGGIVNNVWSVAGDKSNTFLLQPFINYNFKGGWFVSTSPIITANWEAASGQQWTVPIGAGGGKLQFFGKVPVNFAAQAFWNAVHPDQAATWSLRLQATLIL